MTIVIDQLLAGKAFDLAFKGVRGAVRAFRDQDSLGRLLVLLHADFGGEADLARDAFYAWRKYPELTAALEAVVTGELLEHDAGVQQLAELIAPRLVRTPADAQHELARRMAAAVFKAAPLVVEGGTPETRLLLAHINDVRELLLHTHDRPETTAAQHATWEPDPGFRGRSTELAALERLLRPGSAEAVAPVVLRGMPGTGKTAIALQFGALFSPSLTPVFISATSREAVWDALLRLPGAPDALMPEPGLPGPVAPALPATSAMLLIIDGIQDPAVVRGLIARRNLCRVVLTSTRQLDEGYEQIEVNTWEREPQTSRDYITSAWDTITPADADRLAGALHHHPLAITQAVSLCRVQNVSVDDYLAQLSEAPEITLSTDLSGAMATTVLTSIGVNLQAARERDPDALALLGIVALLGTNDLGAPPVGATGIPESLIADAPGVVAFLGTGALEDAPLIPSDEGAALKEMLGDHARRRRAKMTLTALSLVDLRGESFAVHPLTKLVFEAAAGDLRPWLEVGFGMFAHYFASGMPDGAAVNPVLDLPVLARLVDASFRLDVTGPALYASLILLAPWLAGRGDPQRARRYAEQAVGWAAGIAVEPAGMTSLIAARSSLAEVLLLDDDVNRALELYEQNALAAQSTGNAQVEAVALQELAMAAVYARDRDLMNRCRERLGRWDFEQVPRALEVALRGTLARVLVELGETADAQAEIERALERLRAVADGDRAMLRLRLLQTAAGIAAELDQTGLESDRLHAELLLALEESGVEEHALGYAAVVVSAADAAIDVDALDRAEQLLERVERVQDHSAAHSDRLAWQVLALRGRLQLQRALAGDFALVDAARENLTRAIHMRRQTGARGRRGLSAPLVHLGQVLAIQGQFQCAERALQEALEIDSDVHGPEHPEALTDARELATIRELRAEHWSHGVEPLIEMHPRRSIAAGIVAEFAAPPPLVPMLLLDLGFSELEPEHAVLARTRLLASGLSEVKSTHEVYPAAFAWSYAVTRESNGSYRIRVAGPGRPAAPVYDGLLHADDAWRRVESQLRQVLLAVGCFGLSDIEASGGEDLAGLIEATLASGNVVGATIGRHAQPHRARQRNA